MRDLSGLFRPERVAVVGATPREGSIGRAVVENLVDGFEGDVVPVNPNHESVLDRPCAPSIGAAGDVDLAIVVVPATVAVEVLAEAGEAGVRNAVVITAGFSEVGEAGAERERELRAVAEEYGMAVVGPNSLGIMSTPVGLNATFSPLQPLSGSISMLSQSGAFVTAAVDWATDRGIGFRDVVSLGNAAVLSETDVIEHWGEDPQTDVIVGYVEAIDHGREFIERVREVTPETPVVLLKSGRSAAGAAAAASHTGSMAGSDRAYDAGFEQAGVLRPDTVEGLFDAAATLAGEPLPEGDGVGIVTNAGGPGVLASDAIAESRLSLSSFAEETVARLEDVLPGNASPSNPVDVVGDADVERFEAALDAVLDDPEVDSAILLSAPTAIFEFDELAEAIIEVQGDRKLPLVTCLMGGDRTEPAVERLRGAGVPNYFDPARAVRSLDALAAYGEVRQREYGEPLRFDLDERTIREILDDAAARGDDRISVDAMAVLEACGVPTPPGELATSPEAAAEIARRIGGPVAMKVASPDVLHKSDVGGVELDVPEASVAGVYAEIVERIERQRPDAEIRGVQVERQVPADHGVETIVGATRDPQFGPLVMFGLGGIFVEVFEDVSFRVAPVSEAEARAMTREIDAAEMLRGARGRAPVDLDAVVETIGRLTQLALDFPEVRELDVNPLLAGPDGVTALDFRLAFDPEDG